MAWLKRKQTDAATPSSSPGGPVYDASIHGAVAGEQAVIATRLQVQRDLHLFDHKGAAADAYSHYRDSQPSQVAVQMMGLAAQRDAIVTATSRKYDQPFPGVELGHLPSFSRSPDTNPMLGTVVGKTHHAHDHSSRAGRARLGR